VNIFYVDNDPFAAAMSLTDKHVVKMVLETAQLLSTAHRLIDGKMHIEYRNTPRKKKVWVLPDAREFDIYKVTHQNHPSAIWCRETDKNYKWLLYHFVQLLGEYKLRYGKNHKCTRLIDHLILEPRNIQIGEFTSPPQCMPDEYKNPDTVTAYRNYYRVGKAHLHKWTKREPPEWL
jgi:hypothetical protein